MPPIRSPKVGKKKGKAPATFPRKRPSLVGVLCHSNQLFCIALKTCSCNSLMILVNSVNVFLSGEMSFFAISRHMEMKPRMCFVGGFYSFLDVFFFG